MKPANETPTAAIPSARVPEHEPWAGHENLGGSVALTPDTFRKNTKRDVRSQPTTQPTETEATPEAPAEDGVIKKPGLDAGIPTDVASGLSSVAEGISSSSVGDFINSIVDAGKAITFGVGQSIVGAIDNIAGPGTLANIASVGGSIISDLTNSASSLLETRTTLAKGKLPTSVSESSNTGVFNNSADRAIVADVGSGKYEANQIVTMADGTQLRVQEVDGKRSLVNFNVE